LSKIILLGDAATSPVSTAGQFKVDGWTGHCKAGQFNVLKKLQKLADIIALL